MTRRPSYNVFSNTNMCYIMQNKFTADNLVLLISYCQIAETAEKKKNSPASMIAKELAISACHTVYSKLLNQKTTNWF